MLVLDAVQHLIVQGKIKRGKRDQRKLSWLRIICHCNAKSSKHSKALQLIEKDERLRRNLHDSLKNKNTKQYFVFSDQQKCYYVFFLFKSGL